MRTTIFAQQALLPTGWGRDVLVAVENGRIAALEAGASPEGADERCALLLPTLANLHSHAFQRAMAGLAERRGPRADTFWTWREEMYRHALAMTPDDAQAVAAMLYVEMLEAGFGRVGEFHYLHHDHDGSPYSDIAEMAGRIAAAACETGIRLTLLPVFYAHSTFAGVAPTEGQRRFINDIDGFGNLLESSRKAVESLSEAIVGVAPHSLRAVTSEELATVAAMAGDGPIHIHIAEQMKEVRDCLEWSGARPMQWLLANMPVDRRWCLIHATHMDPQEAVAMARSGAIAGLCPITEANLGDGIFQGPLFAENGGSWGVGSDSNILIGLADELRQFEYSQRLASQARNVMAQGPGSTGRALFEAALAGGGAATGVSSTGIEMNAPADLFALDLSQPTFEGKQGDGLLDAFIFAGAGRPDRVWIGGEKLVENGRHMKRSAVEHRFRAALRNLADARP